MRAPRFAVGVYVLSAILVAAPFSHGAEQGGHPLWLTDYEKAAKLSVELDRPLVIHFGAPWCGPCNLMERETLYSPDVARMVQNGFVAVKVNVDAAPAVAEQFGVQSMPTDLIIGTDGKVLYQSEGYTGRADKLKYIAALSRIEARFAETRRTKALLAETPTREPPVERALQQKGDKLPPYPTEEPSANSPRPRQDNPQLANRPPTIIPPAQNAPAEIGLDGYCPVTLRNTKTWKKGRTDISLDYQGQTYYFQSDADLSAFKSNPTRYSPRCQGLDPVVLSESDLAAPGTTKYGAFYDGELFLFKSAETRARFRTDPMRYSKVRHVLKPDDAQKRRA